MPYDIENKPRVNVISKYIQKIINCMIFDII